MNRYYAVKYMPDGKGCPYLLTGDFSPEDFEFGYIEPKPLEIVVTEEYSLQLTASEVKFLDFDYYDNEPRLVSNRFLEVCDELDVPFKAIPLSISLKKGSNVAGRYYFFFAGENVGLLNQEQSAYTLEHVVESGEVMANHAFPPYPIYSKIENFIPKEARFPDLFFSLRS